MLVLSRKLNEEIVIGENVKITILKIKGNTVRLGIEAPRDVRVVRGELPAKPDPKPRREEVTIVFHDTKDKPVDENSIDVVPFQPKANLEMTPPTRRSSEAIKVPHLEDSRPNRLQEILAELSGQ